MTSNEIRASFLEYFGRHGHRIVASSSLVPHDDPTLLFTNAGMNQFKDLFLGKERRDYRRAASSQKCMRVSGKHNDLDNVGPSLRHHTFFEMLGNFSFGDYFKEGAIEFAWTLLTEEWKIPHAHLVATIFQGEGGIPKDDAAYTGWRRFLPAEQIFELGLADNFWSMGDTGPCGRCSEIHYFRGNDVPCREPDCKGVACSCDRYMEIWNNVFMEFDRQADGRLNPLPAPSIDTGMGLERISAVLQGTISNYDTDLFTPILHEIGMITGVPYTKTTDDPKDISTRVIADHIRAMTFLIADGVIPSNEWRGYVLRKIMRRAMRHGKHLGRIQPFLFGLVDGLVREMGDAYPELRTNRELIIATIRAEENRFDAVLNDGLPKLEVAIAKALETSDRLLVGDTAFRLYDTFGLPYDFIEDTAATRDVTVDRAGYERAMAGQRDKARAQSAFDGKQGEEEFSRMMPSEPEHIDRELFDAAPTHFVGYEDTRAVGPLLMMWDERGMPTSELAQGDVGYMALAKTPFYVEAGGQVDDRGKIVAGATGATATVEKMVRRPASVPRVHKVHVASGTFKRRDIVTAEVDGDTRDATRRNHTATHLLHAALRKVLGAHVKQAGSLVAPDRLRFDFVHHTPLTREEILAIERLVNHEIYRNTTVVTEERSTEEALAAGAMALFGEKYGDRVRVVSVPGFSMELCGGTHCRATGDIGFFTIVSEGGVAAGVRRIEALTGAGAVAAHQVTRGALENVLGVLGTTADQAPATIEHLQAEAKRLARELSKLKVESARGQQGQLPAAVHEVEIAGTRLVTQKAENLEKGELRQLADVHRDRIKSGVVIIASTTDGRVSIVVSVSKDLAGRVHAGQIVKQIAPIVGGSGGGRPDFAEAGGKDDARIDDMLAESRRVVEKMLLPNIPEYLKVEDGL